jgi:hypothetical protein
MSRIEFSSSKKNPDGLSEAGAAAMASACFEGSVSIPLYYYYYFN